MEKSASEMLEELTELYVQQDLLAIDKKRTEKDAIPKEVANTLLEIEAEYLPKQKAINQKIEELEARIKETVKKSRSTVKGGSLQAVFSKGRITWDSKGLDGLIVAVPQLSQFRKVGDSSVSIRKVDQ